MPARRPTSIRATSRGSWSSTRGRKQKPGIVDARQQDVLLPEQVYAGQLVRAQITPFAWENSGKTGVSFGLNHIQIVKHDAPRIDGKLPPKQAFPDLPDEMLGNDEDSPF